MNRQTIGILAHVDAGKTTLSEALLYLSGSIKNAGRVDKGDAFLDNFYLERQRGITIFSKEARLNFGDMEVTLLDTPGHVDFSGEMERVLSVLDTAILVISGADGVQSHTVTLMKLLESYNIPTFVFVNKMDREAYPDVVTGSTPEEIRGSFIAHITDKLGGNFVDFTDTSSDDFHENIALSEEDLMEAYLEGSIPTADDIRNLVSERKLFPVYFGTALKLSGVQELMDGISCYAKVKVYPSEFGARVYKISRDDNGNRLTHIKVTGGSLKNRDVICGSHTVIEETEEGEEPVVKEWQQKITGIRLYSGDGFEAVSEVKAGTICAVTGLLETRVGEGLGIDEGIVVPSLEPVLTYKIILPKGISENEVMPYFKELEEEDPLLNVIWNREHEELSLRVMGDVQVEVLKEVVKNRFDLDIELGNGAILYRETIGDTVEGVGHFEPLRHYAEVHLLMEPLPAGSGLVFETNVSEDILSKNWQRLILTHLKERTHKGVLTGSPITDMKITVISGKAHIKHTEGGDFRQATYRAVRQGLMEAESILLEPYYEFEIRLPAENLGRAMTDIDGMRGVIEPPETEGEEAILRGKAPVSLMMDYQKDIMAYTKGLGQISLSLWGYLPCHNPEEVIERRGYDPERDRRNPCGSVFCEGGSGVYVPWNEVKNRCDMPLITEKISYAEFEGADVDKEYTSVEDMWIDVEEVDAILRSAGSANKKPDFIPHKGINRGNKGKKAAAPTGLSKPVKTVRKEKYLLVDGYNIIYAWDELKALSEDNIDGARGRLIDILINYRSITGVNLILVFDAYRIQGHRTEVLEVGGIQVVYTKEAETADQYIEKFAHKNASNYDITVATSDGLEQIIIRGAGCGLISSREFEKEVKRANDTLREDYSIE
ncbi:MAG: GTP-binding protein [Lachnospiraceae bacterium]|nr:GTP-binding protein [Lachnospiraceae bacterium]